MTLPSRLLSSSLLVLLFICGPIQTTAAAEVTQITLAWDPVESTKEHKIKEYNVYFITGGEEIWERINRDPVPQAESPFFGPVTVTYGTKYQFFVTAIDSNGLESGPSNFVIWPFQVFTLKDKDIETYSIYPESTYTIEWYAAPKAEHFRVLYSTNNGGSWKVIADGVTERRSDWTAPFQSRNKTGCLIRVIGFDSKGAKVGDARSEIPFAIEVVKLLPVNNYAPLTSGMTCPIAWQIHPTKSPVASISVYYTLNGSSWKKVETPEGYFESFDWEVPAVKKPSYRCKVKVVLKDAKGETIGEDVSDTFPIYP